MATRLILARHGNTFRSEDTPVWVGARTDMPLVEKGLAQAQSVAVMLQRLAITPDALIAAPLQRTRQTADIIADTLRIPRDKIRIDNRLTEIDYGAWEGKSTQDIVAMGDGEKLAAWDKQSVFPADVGWHPAEATIIAHIRAIMDEATTGTSVVISSNGILRCFAQQAENLSDFPALKISTGHIGIIEKIDSKWHIQHWNSPPDSLIGLPQH